MKTTSGIGLSDVQAVYNGMEGRLWELLMGQQIHIGGFKSSMDLAERAGIGGGLSGVDLCCCTGAGMRFLARFRNVKQMHGVDATKTVLELGKKRAAEEGLAERLTFVQADVCSTGLPGENFDFVWGEDAWCYVVDKPALINEAARLLKPGGTIAFTDWVEGPSGLSDAEAERFLKFMKFPNFNSPNDYREQLAAAGCEVLASENTGRFAPYVDFYLEMIDKQFLFDALRILDFNMPVMEYLGGEMQFMQQLAHAGKLSQGLFVAKKKEVESFQQSAAKRST